LKDVSLIEAFCEVLSGIGFLFLLLPALHLAGITSVGAVICYIATSLTVAGFGAFLLGAYVLGAAVADPAGLAIDEFLGSLLRERWTKAADWLWGPTVSAANKGKFWRTVSDHVLKYRELQWAYYSAYRNLFILFAPASVLWTIIAWRECGWARGVEVLGVCLILEGALFYSAKVLSALYADITNDVASGAAQ
jgi:hypothetical protein